MATDDTSETAGEARAPARKGIGVGALIGIVLLSIGASAGLSWFLIHSAVSELKPPSEATEDGAEAEPDVPKEPANYLALDPAFVVNLNDDQASRFLQVQVEVMTRDKDTVEKVELHAPRIRSALLLLLGQQTVAELQTREGKEKLQAQVLEEINGILKAETGEGNVEAVYFTSFVIQ